MFQAIELAVFLLALIFFSILSYKKRALDLKGIIIANFVGLIVFWYGGLLDFFCMVVFFAVSELCTRYARQFSREKHETRTIENILGNSGAAIIAVLLQSQIGFFGAIAAAFADTLGSEIGLLSKKKPVMITSFKTVEAGTNGAISVLGCIAALVGAAIIGTIHFVFFSNAFLAIGIVLAGFFGSLVDSLFGALFERKGGLNNAEVNFFGNSAGAIIAFILSKLF